MVLKNPSTAISQQMDVSGSAEAHWPNDHKLLSAWTDWYRHRDPSVIRDIMSQRYIWQSSNESICDQKVKAQELISHWAANVRVRAIARREKDSSIRLPKKPNIRWKTRREAETKPGRGWYWAFRMQADQVQTLKYRWRIWWENFILLSKLRTAKEKAQLIIQHVFFTHGLSKYSMSSLTKVFRYLAFWKHPACLCALWLERNQSRTGSVTPHRCFGGQY